MKRKFNHKHLPKELKREIYFDVKTLKRINIFLWNWTIIELGSLWEPKKLMPRWNILLVFISFKSLNKHHIVELFCTINYISKYFFFLFSWNINFNNLKFNFISLYTKHPYPLLFPFLISIFFSLEVHQFSLVLFQVSIHNTSVNWDVKNFHHVSNIVTVPIFQILLDIFSKHFPS